MDGERARGDSGESSNWPQERGPVAETIHNWETHVLAALSAIPFAGGPLATYFAEYRSARQRQRVERYIAAMSAEFHSAKEESIDKAFLASEEFAELWMTGAIAAAKAVEDEKIQALAGVVVSAATYADLRSFAEHALELCSVLTPFDVQVLRDVSLLTTAARTAGSRVCVPDVLRMVALDHLMPDKPALHRVAVAGEDPSAELSLAMSTYGNGVGRSLQYLASKGLLRVLPARLTTEEESGERDFVRMGIIGEGFECTRLGASLLRFLRESFKEPAAE